MEKMLILGSGGFRILGLFYTVNFSDLKNVFELEKTFLTLELIPENENRKLP